MASFSSIFKPHKTIILLALVALTITCTTSARFLTEDDTLAPIITPEEPDTPASDATPVLPAAPVGPAATGADNDTPAPATTPEEPDAPETPASSVLPVVPTAQAGAAVTGANSHHTLTFFMHDILGGSNPSTRAVTGIVTNPALNAQVAFAKPNGAVLPVQGGIPQNSNNNGIVNNNNIPFLTGLGGATSNVVQNNGNNLNNGGIGFPITNGTPLPPGMTFQKLMFGTLTVFDDELTEGHELGSGLIGKSQGFYISSSVDGTSQTMAFTAMFAEGGYADSLSFFGVHRTPVSESHLAVMGGTGKYVNAQGFAIVKTFPVSNAQHNTDGVDTVVQITVYLTY